MEKFRQFADESTGINPFIPIWGQNKSSPFRKLLGIPVFILRLTFLLPSTIMYFLFVLITELVYFDSMRVILFSILVNGVSRVMLFTTGCIWINKHVECAPEPNSGKNASVDGIKSRRIIFSNRQSFTDILVYSSILGDPEYVIVDKSGVKLIRNSFCGLLYLMGLTSEFGVKRVLGGKLSVRYTRRPLVIFMEEANTNGSCILAWNNIDKIADNSEMREFLTRNAETNVISYDLGSSIYGPQFTTGNLSQHLLQMLSCVKFYKVNMRTVTKEYLKEKIISNSLSLRKGEGVSLKDIQKSKSLESYLSVIEQIQGRTSNLPIVRNGAAEALSFVEYWEKANKGKSL